MELYGIIDTLAGNDARLESHGLVMRGGAHAFDQPLIFTTCCSADLKCRSLNKSTMAQGISDRFRVVVLSVTINGQVQPTDRDAQCGSG